MSTDKTGLFISIEGIDGAGKTTLIHTLSSWLTEQHYTVICTKEPGGTPVGKQLREILQHQGCGSNRSEFLLFAADRAHHVETVIRPALNNGHIVISDRYIDSSIAYQGYGLSQDLETIEKVNNWATMGLQPDCTLYVKVDPHTSEKRINTRSSRTVIEQRDNGYWEKVIHGFNALAEKHDRIWTLDGTQKISDITLEAKKIISSLLP